MDAAEARSLFATARVARLATADGDCRPHVVPVVFALAGETVYHAVDRKPKRTTALKRLANVAENPRASLLADHYDDDWDRLWWVRADGRARIVEPGADEWERAITLLRERYPQYVTQPPEGPAVALEVERWSGWRASR